MATATLTTSRYVEPGVYIGELLNPESSNLSADARIPAIIAKGSRYAVARNVPILRSFIQAERLNFSPSSPFLAPLLHPARGDKLKPSRIFKQDGTELNIDEWAYVEEAGKFQKVQIRDESFDSTATYYIDYQSLDRAVQDPIPVEGIRQIRLMGNQMDRAQYKEYSDYFVPMTFTEVQADVSNVHVTGFLSSITSTLQPGSTGSVSFDSSAAYDHAYSRSYKITVLAVSGTPGSRIAQFKWESTLASGGNNAAPPVPLHTSDSYPQFSIDETNPSSFTQTLENGIVIDLNFGGSNFVSGDLFTFSGNGPSLVEIDSRYSSPQFATINPPELVSGSEGNLIITPNPLAIYSGKRNNKYRLKLLSISGSHPTRTLHFCWARYGDVLPTSGEFTVYENSIPSLTQTLSDGVKIDFVVGTNSPTAGTQWDILAQAPRFYYTAKDSREYKLTVSAVTSPSAGITAFSGGYSTDTTEGRFGTWSAQFDAAGANGDGYALLPDNFSVAIRNASSIAALDIFNFGVMDLDLIDWSLNASTTDVRQITDFLTDANGKITGIAGQKYVILSNVPTDQASIQVQNYNTGASISFNWNVGTPYIFFTVDPAAPIKVSYRYRGPEPDPGQTYYISVSFLRPDNFYNSPFLVLRKDDGRNFAAPSTVDNDLYIGNEILWNNGGVAAYLVQPKNIDGSGVYTKPDYQAAIESIRSYPRVSDVCLLNYNSALEYAMEENILGNDPFEKRPNLLWVGMPIGTPIGDENTDGTLVSMARRTLQVRSDSAAKGTRIMIAPTRATMTVVLDNGISTSVTLDGSFVALAGAARVASFADPATDILNTSIVGFDTIEVYTKEENRILGAAQINYVNGSPGSYTWGEDVTVDTTSNFDRIQLMTQRHFVTKVVTREMASLIGITPSSNAAAKELIRGKLGSILRGLLARGLIGQYQDTNGNVRNFDPQADVMVSQDQDDLSLFYFNYAWYSRNVIKRLFGLYALNSNDFSTGVALR